MSKPFVVALPDGQSAMFRDPDQVPERLRRPVARTLMSATSKLDRYRTDAEGNHILNADGSPIEMSSEEMGAKAMANGGMDAITEANDYLVLALVSQWSYDAPLTMDGLLDLPGASYDALREAAAPYLWAMMPKNFGPSPDQASPTSPSGD